MDSDSTPPQSADDDVTDEELAAALALIKKRRAEQAALQAQETQPSAALLATPVPVPAPVPTAEPRPNPAAVRAQNGTAGLAALLPAELPAPVLGICPSCKRKLLTRTSALCNWCGAKISSTEYQEQAARTRQEMDAAVRETAAARAEQATQRGLLNRLKRRIKPGDDTPRPTQT